MASLYEIIIKDKQGNTAGVLQGARDRWFELELNKPGAAGFVVSPTDARITADLLLAGQKEVYIRRGGVTLWGGEISYRRTDVGSDGVPGTSVSARGFLALMGQKVIGSLASPRVFDDEDLSQIAETIRSETQTGTDADLGTDAGTLATSRDGDRTYKFDNAQTAIEGLTNSRVIDGIDVEVNADNQLMTYYPNKGRDLPDIVFEWGRNITSFYEIVDGTKLANQIIVVGKEDGVSTPVVTRNASSDIQAAYRIRQDVLTRYNVTDTATLAEWGDAELARRQLPQQQIGIRTKGNLWPTLGSYGVGDRVRIVIDYGLVQIDALYRIHKISVRITDNDEEDIDIQFAQDDDIGSTIDELEERVENLEHS